jgi:hypothetical protein
MSKGDNEKYNHKHLAIFKADKKEDVQFKL